MFHASALKIDSMVRSTALQAVEAGEPLAEAAARELAEETGHVPADLIYRGEMCYDAYFGGSRNYFLATGCERRQKQELDPAEFRHGARGGPG